jgi:glycosyltransferase involved in cell wall biosynthesis/UDP:flavonoid glycosyltransferase YjiC (YdhE family)
MHVLFVHPNFPAQFRNVAPRLAADYGWTCSFLTNNEQAPPLAGVRKMVYAPRGGASRHNHFCTRTFESAVAHAHGAYEALKGRPDVRPDLVVAHSGFGSSLFLPYLYDAPVINFFEYFYRPVGQDLGYRPETPVTELMLMRSKARNAMIMLDLDNCDRGWCPNEYQRGLFPGEYRQKIEVIPEGVDTNLYRRDPAARLLAGDRSQLPEGTRVVTYVSRGFEMMRGFDVFMKAAKRVCDEMRDVIFVVVGSDRVCYGGEQQWVLEKSFREHVLRSGDYDLSRFCFTGHVPEATLANLLSVSDVHVYLTVPFVPSWSLLDAMSCSCVVVASDQACVREYVESGRNGLLCDFFDAEGIARTTMQVLRDPAAHRPLGEAARRTVEQKYSLDVSLPRIRRLFEEVAARKRKPSVRAELLTREGMLQTVGAPGGAGASRENTSPKSRPPVPVTSRRPARVGRGAAGSDGRRVLFCWEFGGGLGHMMQILPLARGLVERGHKVFVALQHLKGSAAGVFADSGVHLLQAPCGLDRVENPPHKTTGAFLHILGNVWSDVRALTAAATAWRNLFVLARPDVALLDHSPTALLSSRGLPMRRALIGSGFCCPPDTVPLGIFKVAADPRRLEEEELRLVRRCNRLLAAWKQPAIDRLGRLYSQVDENFLTTFPELEQYLYRKSGAGAPPRYWGAVLPTGGDVPQWPGGEGRRVFAYLKPFAGLDALLSLLAAHGSPVVAYVDGGAATATDAPNIRVASGRLDMARASRECDVAILHAGQGATAAVLLAGKPILQIPLVLEQRLTAQATARLGASETAASGIDASEEVAAKLDLLMGESRYADAALRFARRYRTFDPAQQVDRMVRRVDELLERGTPAAAQQRHTVFAG